VSKEQGGSRGARVIRGREDHGDRQGHECGVGDAGGHEDRKGGRASRVVKRTQAVRESARQAARPEAQPGRLRGRGRGGDGMSGVRVKYTARFRNARPDEVNGSTVDDQPRPLTSRLARQLALAHYIEQLIEDGHPGEPCRGGTAARREPDAYGAGHEAVDVVACDSGEHSLREGRCQRAGDQAGARGRGVAGAGSFLEAVTVIAANQSGSVHHLHVSNSFSTLFQQGVYHAVRMYPSCRHRVGGSILDPRGVRKAGVVSDGQPAGRRAWRGAGGCVYYLGTFVVVCCV